MRLPIALIFATQLLLVACTNLPDQKTVGVDVVASNDLKFREKVSCFKPKKSGKASYSRVGGTRGFMLQHGDIGRCKGDDGPKKSFDPPAPYVERIEISSESLTKGKRYLISTLVHFHPDFDTSRDTKFMQVGQWERDVCNCGAMIKLSVDESGRLFASVLKGHYRYQDYKLGGWTRDDFEDKWVEVTLDMDTGPAKKVTVFIAGQSVLTTRMHVQKGTRVTPKIGLYRPGSTTVTLPTDRVFFKDAWYAELVTK